jgi:hypothetical protein
MSPFTHRWRIKVFHCIFQDTARYSPFRLETSKASPRGNCFVHGQTQPKRFFRQRLPLQVSRGGPCTVTNLKPSLILTVGLYINFFIGGFFYETAYFLPAQHEKEP